MHRSISIATSGIALALSVALIVLVLLSTTGSGGSGWMGGRMTDDTMSLSETGLIVLLIGVVLVTASAVFLTLALMMRPDRTGRHTREGIAREPGGIAEPVSPLSPAGQETERYREAPVEGGRRTSVAEDGPPSGEVTDRGGEERTLEISRLLDGDERRLYEMLVAENGEMLQKEIVMRRVFSKAKVTRLLDRLERRGLIRRERYGATNRIILIR